jgi:hypothetical protein
MRVCHGGPLGLCRRDLPGLWLFGVAMDCPPGERDKTRGSSDDLHMWIAPRTRRASSLICISSCKGINASLAAISCRNDVAIRAEGVAQRF